MPITISIFIAFVIIFVSYLGIHDLLSFGVVKEKISNKPMSFARIKLFNANTGTEIKKTFADINGKYKLTPPKEKFYMAVEKRNFDGSYTQIWTSKSMTKKVSIKQVIEI